MTTFPSDSLGAQSTPLRSWMFVPCNRQRFLEKIYEPGPQPDGVFLDLEDGVVPDAKQSARENAAAVLREARPGPFRAVRVNAVGSDWFEQDMEAVVGHGLEGLCVPRWRGPAICGRWSSTGAARPRRLGPDHRGDRERRGPAARAGDRRRAPPHRRDHVRRGGLRARRGPLDQAGGGGSRTRLRPLGNRGGGHRCPGDFDRRCVSRPRRSCWSARRRRPVTPTRLPG